MSIRSKGRTTRKILRTAQLGGSIFYRRAAILFLHFGRASITSKLISHTLQKNEFSNSAQFARIHDVLLWFAHCEQDMHSLFFFSGIDSAGAGCWQRPVFSTILFDHCQFPPLRTVLFPVDGFFGRNLHKHVGPSTHERRNSDHFSKFGAHRRQRSRMGVFGQTPAKP